MPGKTPVWVIYAGAVYLDCPDDAQASKEEQQSRAVFQGLQQGKINRSLFTDNANSYFTEQGLQDFAVRLFDRGAREVI